MFGFLKDKLKGAVDSIKKAVEDIVTTEEVEVKEPKKEKKKIEKKPVEKKKKEKVEKKEEKKKEEVKVEKVTPKVEVKEKKTKKEEKVVEEEPEEKKSFFKRIFSKKEEKEEEPVKEKKEKPKEKEIKETTEKESVEVVPDVEEEPEPEVETKEEIIEEEPEEVDEASKPEVKEEPKEEEKKGFFKRITETITKFNLSEEKFEELFWQLEVTLLENNVAVEVIEKIKHDLKEELTTGKVSRKGVEEVIKDSLRKSIEEVLDVETFDLVKKAKSKKPFIISFIGVNGSGKTTTMAKVAHLLLKNNLSIVFAAADTFRAAAIQQLEEHANNLGVKMIKHDYNADPTAVAYDAIEHAKSKGIDVVMIDTAGRLHSNTNLMQELKKLVRINKPDLKIFVGESITGNDCVEQARVYNQEIGIDAIILAKADVDEKGGAALSVSYITKKPILYLGTGQTYDDLKKFDKKLIVESLGL